MVDIQEHIDLIKVHSMVICFIVGNRRGSQSDLEGNFDLILLCLAQIQIRMWKSGEYPDLWWGLFIVVA